MTISVNSIDELQALSGRHLGTSDWAQVDQDRIGLFAEATGDHQWIHVDPERAAKGQFGTTIAHGYLTLSLIPAMLKQVWSVDGALMGLNYGLGKVRFPAPVPVDSNLRLDATLAAVEVVDESWATITIAATMEIEDSPKPACVAEVIFRYKF